MSPQMLEHVNEPPRDFYDPPDLFNPNLHPPSGALDLLNIVEAGIDFRPTLNPDYTSYYKKPTFSKPPQVPIGKGAYLSTVAGDHTCDGTVDSWCKRGYDETCLLYAHNDGRNGILIDGYSGWLVFNIPDLQNGYIAIKFESWHPEGLNGKTNGWESINNEARRELSGQQLRGYHHESDTHTNVTSSHDAVHYSANELGFSQPESRRVEGIADRFCEEFRFAYAIDGKKTSLSKADFVAAHQEVQRVVEIITLLRDPNYTGGKEKEVEVAVRITGCQRKNTFKVNHLYWS